MNPLLTTWRAVSRILGLLESFRSTSQISFLVFTFLSPRIFAPKLLFFLRVRPDDVHYIDTVMTFTFTFTLLPCFIESSGSSIEYTCAH